MTVFVVERTDHRGWTTTAAVFHSREMAEAMEARWNADSEERSLPYTYKTEELKINE